MALMRSRTLVAAVLGLLLGAWPSSAQYPTSSVILQSAVSANGNGSNAAATGFPLIGVQATTSGGPPTFTLNFEVSIDGSTFVATLCRPVGSTAQVTTSTAAGEWRCPVAGARFFRARVSGYAGSGTITVLGVLIAGGSNQVDALQSGEWTLAHITSVTHVAAASPFPVTLSVLGHVSSVTHIAASGVFPVQQGPAGTALWPVAAHQSGQWNVAHASSVTHISAAGVFPVQQGPAGSAAWPVTAHQGGQWNVAHVSSVVHVAASSVLSVAQGAGTAPWIVTAHQSGIWTIAHVSAQVHVAASVDSPIPTGRWDSRVGWYFAGQDDIVPAAAATDIFVLSGSGSTRVYVTRVVISGTAGVAAKINVQLVKRTTANSAGTAATVAIGHYSSSQSAPTATAAAYTANPTLGSSTGLVRSVKFFFGVATAAGDPILTIDLDPPVVLRGTAEGLAVNLDGSSLTTGSLNVSMDFAEKA